MNIKLVIGVGNKLAFISCGYPLRDNVDCASKFFSGRKRGGHLSTDLHLPLGEDCPKRFEFHSQVMLPLQKALSDQLPELSSLAEQLPRWAEGSKKHPLQVCTVILSIL